MNSDGSDIKAWPVALLRIYTGIFFLYYGLKKVIADEFNIAGFLDARLEDAYDFYQPLMESIFIPNSGLFSFLVTWGEISLGAALIVGLGTRYAALAGAFMVANFWLAKGTSFLAAQNHDAVWIVVLLVLAFVPAGQILGLDQRLSGRYPLLR